jgi:multiple sugar transport system substrate-binding protein
MKVRGSRSERRLRRRVSWLVALAALAAAMLLAACGGSDSDDSSATTSDSGKQSATVQWWDSYGNIPERNKELQEVFDRIRADTGVTVKRTTFEYGEFRDKLVQAAATGQFPDLAFVDQGDVPIYADQGIISDVTDKVNAWDGKDQILPNILEAVHYKDRYWGVPFLTNATALFYNAEQFRAAGISSPPATWDELSADAKKLTRGSTSGFCFAANANEEGSSVFEPFLWQAGGDVPTIGDQASVDALDYVNSFVEDGSAPKSILSWGQNDIANQFIAGNCSMMVNGPWELGALADQARFEWNAAPLPRGVDAASSLGGEQLVISKDADMDAAWTVAEQVLDPAVIGRVAIDLGGLPNRRDTESDPAWTTGKGRQAFADSVKFARPRSVYGPKYNQISEQIWTMVQNVLSGTKSSQDAANEAGSAIQPLLPSS